MRRLWCSGDSNSTSCAAPAAAPPLPTTWLVPHKSHCAAHTPLQAVNADPDSFLWEAGKTVVTAAIPGLYEISLGFFSRRRPIVQVLVNGEPVLSVTGTSGTVVHHVSGSGGGAAAQLMPSALQGQAGGAAPAHSAGNVAGLTTREFLSLPPNARIAVTFQGEPERTEGFLMLRKL